MGMTMTQKILAAHAGLEEVKAGQLITCKLDLVLGNDITIPPAINEFRKTGQTRVFDKDRVVMVPSHFAPNKDIKSAENCKQMRLFAGEQDITHYYEQGQAGMGIEHIIVPENGLCLPGYAMIGADSHTCTDGALGAFATGVGSTDLAYSMATGENWFRVPEAIRFVLTGELKAPLSGKDIILYIISKIGVSGALYQSMEFTGPGVSSVGMADRLTVCNMAVEAGAKNGIFPADEICLEYIKEKAAERFAAGDYTVYSADEDAVYARTMEINLSELPLMVAFPSLPENGHAIGTFDEIKIDQAVIGSCTNGRIEDMRIAAKILRGQKVAEGVRLFVIPGSQKVFKQCLQEGLTEIFVEAGAVVSPPTCGPCIGGHMGVLASGETCISTTNRNFIGRMGSPGAFVYLSGVAVAAASAIAGKITGP